MSREDPELSFGVIGCGRVVTELHVPAWRQISTANCKAVCDPKKSSREGVSDQLSAERTYAEVDELLGREELDFVVIATPGPTHTDITKRALNHNFDVLCEKPIAYTRSELGEIASTVDRVGQLVCPIHNYRFKPATRRARAAFEEESIEHLSLKWRIRSIQREHASWLRSEKENRLMLFDFAYHFVDILCWLVGQPPKISCIETRSTEEFVESIVAYLDFTDTTATVDLRLDCPSVMTHLEIVGENKTGKLEFFPDGFRTSSGVDTPVHRGFGDVNRTVAYGLRYLAALSGLGLPQRAVGHYRIFSQFVSSAVSDRDNPVPLPSVEATIDLLERIGDVAYEKPTDE